MNTVIRPTVLSILVLFGGLSLAGCDKQDATPAAAHGAEAGHADAAAKPGAKRATEGEGEAAERTVIQRAIADANGIRTAVAGPGVIATELEVQGLLAPIDGSLAHVTARFPGPIRALRANVGDRVKAGQALVSIDSNLSLSTYSVSTPISGVVLSRQAQVGGVASEGQTLFEIADLSRLWVDLHVFGMDSQRLQPGVPITVTRMYDGVSASTTLERVLPGAATASQSAIARATVANSDGLWRPGTAVTARIAVATRQAPLVIAQSALQTVDGRDTVFVRQGDTYTARAVTVGERDAKVVEVTGGLRAGDEVVVEQSYLVKADIEKSGASHEH